jgi:hypothetical protein
MFNRSLTVLATSVFFLAAAPLLLAADGFKDEKGKHLDILHKGKPLVRYMYAYDQSTKEAAHETYKVYHHVMDEEGKDTLTKGAGGKFTHHRGLVVGWAKLKVGDKGYDTWHMKNCTIKHIKIVKQEATKEASTLTTEIHWLANDGSKILEETRTVKVYHNDDAAHALIDWSTTLKASDGDLQLKGDPEHAGFQYRPHNDVAGNKSAKYTFHKDGLNLKKDYDLPWVGETYELRGKKYTVQHMNHPDNPKKTVYSAYRDYGRFGAFFQTDIKNGESLTIKYRIRVISGDKIDRSGFDEQYSAYLKQLPPK